ncbi:porin family protein [Tabrizicola sp. TH137]|uniref:outer membrane protein n=1 Tax=Tabrizicola sp. TH137 TaxID=2067452 RepID=UPI000C7BABE3|nr:porin [Tabrizicola sp. TH137]PLL13722.1 porin family protein [Tabrizicola sp. TH137]
MKRSMAMAAAAVTLGAMPALAGGPVQVAEEPMVAPAPVPVAAPSADWSGLYVGGQLGYGDVGSTGALAGDGETAGLFAGYRADFGQFVTGVEGNFDWANIDLGGGTSLDSISRLKLIGGYDMGPALVYGTVAAVRADTTLGADNGYGLGVGVDYAVSDQMTLGAELMEHRFDNFVGSGTDIDATTLNARVGFRF